MNDERCTKKKEGRFLPRPIARAPVKDHWARRFFDSESGLMPNRIYGRITIMAEVGRPLPKPVHWIGRSREDLREFPDGVMRNIGQALWFAQTGDKHPSAKPLKGFKGAGVLDIVEDYSGDAYRAVYTVRFRRAIYVLHTFKKRASMELRRRSTRSI